jgi:hypothetical protein
VAVSTTGVAQRIARLTPDATGLAVGDFTDTTFPKQADVQALLDNAVARVNARFGTGDTELATARDDAAQWIAAAAVALSYDPTRLDLIGALRQMANDTLTDLAAGYARLHPGTDPDGGTSSGQRIEGYVGTPGTPVFCFPPGPYDVVTAPLAERPLGQPGEWVPPPFDGRV